MKFAAYAADMTVLAHALAGMAGGAGNAMRLVSTYYDTPDRALARRGLSLRLREQDGRFVQTVKSQEGDRGGLFSRGEWEDRVAGPAPDPTAPVSGGLVGPDIALRLVPLFRTEIDRRTFDLSPAAGCRIEAAVDGGRIHAMESGRSEPVCEVELELKEGPAARLYDAALDLLTVAPLRLEQRSKAERGYRLAGDDRETAAAAHATAIPLDPKMTGDAALQRIGLVGIGQILGNAQAVLAGSAEGVHQMRVAVRRLRALLSAFGKLQPRDERQRISAELRWLADALGGARNLEIFAHALLPAATDAACRAEELAGLREAIERRRRQAYRAAARAIASPRFTAVVLHALRWFETCGWRRGDGAPDLRRPLGSLAGGVLDRRRRSVKRRGKGFSRQSAAQRHRLRIAVKKLRYAGEALAGLYDPDRSRRYLKLLNRLQDDLGNANDVRVGHAIVAELARCRSDRAISATGEAVLRWHEVRLKKQEPKTQRRLDRLLDAGPFWTV